MDEGNMEHDTLQDIFDGIIKPTDVKFSDLERITGNFSEKQIIGEGGFGTVYKGVLQNGEVAVKRIKSNHTIDENVFRREVNSLLNVSHENIVRLLGFCSHTEHKVFENKGSRDYIYAENRERILCFEYINNGSLQKYIADELRGLQWDTRYSIIKGICEGLQYLHVKIKIIHRDLKPANILIDNNMVAKITDFGLARMEENAHIKSTTGTSTPGYTAPEYIDSGEMSVKYDVYSLGVIIIELVTGSRSIPDSNIVLRRWRHRLHKLGEETPNICQQIAKLIEIGLRCQENKPYKRPSITEIIRDIRKIESTNNNANESTVGQINPYLEDGMLGIEPLELRFPFELNIQMSCSFELTNETNAFIAFSVHKTSPLSFCIQPNKGIVAPQSKYSVKITLQPLDEAPQDKDTGSFIVRSTKVKESLRNEYINEDIFSEEDGNLVDEVNLTITYKGSGTQESNVPPTEVESKMISVSTSDDVIQFDPNELCFPLVPNKRVFSSIKIINTTESYVSCMTGSPESNSAIYYVTKSSASILSPRSTQWLTVTREEKKDAVKDMLFNDVFSVYYTIVAEDIKASDLNFNDHSERKKLPIVLTKVNSCTSSELIQFDPPELSFPCLDKTSLSSVNIVNITDCYIGINTSWFVENVAFYERDPPRAILPPRSTQRVVVRRIPNKKEPEDMQRKDKLFVWNMIVAEGVQESNLQGYTSLQDSKELLVTFKKISPCTSNELIRFDHPGLCFTFSRNKTALCSINMVNVTDYFVVFRLLNSDIDTAVSFHIDTELGILAPRSAQRLVVARLIHKNEPEDAQCNHGRLYFWTAIVSECIQVSDLDSYMSLCIEESNRLPIILNKVTSSTSVDLIKFEPPEIRFPFLPRQILSSSFKIVNSTEYHIGFNTRAEETNVALYIMEPPCGILPPWSTKELVVMRVAKEEAPELEDMQHKDKYFVWSCFVTEDVNASDIKEWMTITERKEVPIVFTETSTNEFIQFEPPEICFPLLPNQRVLSSTKIANTTDQYIGFRICAKKSNSAQYATNPSQGILPPLSTQALFITRIGGENELEDIQCKDKFLVWNGIVTEDVKASDVVDNMSETKCIEFPIVLTKTSSSTSRELIQFDPLELHFPSLPNKKVSTSIKLLNLTDYNVGFNTYSRPTNVAWYHTEPPTGILPPRSTQKLIVTREEKEGVLEEDKHFDDKYFVWKSIVYEGVKDSNLTGCIVDQESKELPIVLDKISSSTSDELIQLDPAELCIPLLLNKRMLLGVNVVNTTDFYVAFEVYCIKMDVELKKKSKEKGILPPRSSKKHIVSWVTSKTELEDMEPYADYFVWSRVVTERVDSGDIIDYMGDEETKKLPFILNKASPCTSNELIQFDPPKLSLPFMSNKPLVFSVNIVNSTDYCVGFNVYNLTTNVGWYFTEPEGGVMPPRSTQRLVVKRVRDPSVPDDIQCKDRFILWTCLVNEVIEASDFVEHEGITEIRKELPIVYKKTSLCTSGELIQLDPPQLTFPFLPNKRVSMLHKLKIINVTNHIVGFSTWAREHEDNSAWYRIEPQAGILPPQSSQTIKVRRTLKGNETEDMQCKDKIFVWNGIVTEGIQASDVGTYWKDGDKELPIVLTTSGGSTHELCSQVTTPFFSNTRGNDEKKYKKS